MTKKRYRTKILLWVVGVIVVLEAAVVLALFVSPDIPFGKGPSIHTIELKNEGFSPNELTIHVGDTVKFTTNRGEQFWPASNLHPTHEIFPEFDPKAPVGPADSWKFTFDKKGVYRFHDHLFANYRGKIIVLADDETSEYGEIKVNKCEELEAAGKQACWDSQLEEVLLTKGLDVAFDFFIDLYKTDPDVPKACHGWGHILGEAGYKLYDQNKNFVLRTETSYCGFGFFHGFIEKLIQETGDISRTKVFCEYVQKSLGEQLPGAYGNCVHGVGHGSTAWLTDQEENWGNFELIAKKGLAICEEVFETAGDLRNCSDGVFNELQQELYHSEYGLSFSDYLAKKDPFWYCRPLPDEYKESCYFEFIGLFNDLFKGDVFAATKYVLKEIPNVDQADTPIAKLAADFMQDDIVKNDYKRNVEACHIATGTLFNYCFGGIVNGFIQHGEPGNEHVRALAFCSENYLSVYEREMCYPSILSHAKSSYSKEKFIEICNSVDKTYSKEYCED